MPFTESMQGKWTGRLVDVQGFEGEISLDLKHDKKGKEVSGSFNVAIGVNHASMRYDGTVSGYLEKDTIKLTFEAKTGKGEPVVITLVGQAQTLREGGAGLKATYEVAAKGFSPLQAGILCVNTGRKPTSVAIERDRKAAA